MKYMIQYTHTDKYTPDAKQTTLTMGKQGFMNNAANPLLFTEEQAEAVVWAMEDLLLGTTPITFEELYALRIRVSPDSFVPKAF